MACEARDNWRIFSGHFAAAICYANHVLKLVQSTITASIVATPASCVLMAGELTAGYQNALFSFPFSISYYRICSGQLDYVLGSPLQTTLAVSVDFLLFEISSQSYSTNVSADRRPPKSVCLSFYPTSFANKNLNEDIAEEERIKSSSLFWDLGIRDTKPLAIIVCVQVVLVHKMRDGRFEHVRSHTKKFVHHLRVFGYRS